MKVLVKMTKKVTNKNVKPISSDINKKSNLPVPMKTKSVIKKTKDTTDLSISNNSGQETNYVVLSKKLKNIRKMNEDGTIDAKYQIALYKALLDSSCNILSMLDGHINRASSSKDINSRLIYVHNHVTSQVREIMADLRMISNNDHSIKALIDIIKSVMTTIAQNQVDLYFNFQKQVEAVADKDTKFILNGKIEEMKSSNGKILNEAYKSLEVAINEFYKISN